MKTIVLLFILLVQVNTSFAHTNNHCEAHSDPVATLEACKNLTYSSEENVCKKNIGGLNADQVRACANFAAFTSDIRVCLKTVAYHSRRNVSVINYCAKEAFSSNKKECLEQF